MPPEPLLEVQDVRVNYGRFEALKGVSYVVREGQIVCLLGGNASGKSTSMKAIFGTVPLASGSVRMSGVDATRRSTVWRVRHGLAAVPEGRRMFAHLTVEENLLVAGLPGLGQSDRQADLARVFAFFPALVALRRRQAGTLSGGEQQMVAFGRALMARPTLICMDEPSMGLSPKLVARSIELIRALRGTGTSVLLIEQNARAALSIADYAYVLRQGEVVLAGTPAEVAADPLMQEAYLGSAGARPSEVAPAVISEPLDPAAGTG